MAATASEVLIKTLSYYLVWEEREHNGSNPPWAIRRSKLTRLFVGSLLSEVLPGALGDYWADQAEADPLWKWRNDLYNTRNRVVHEGHRPTSSEAEASLSALQDLVRHIADRTAARAQHFPRTALVLVGRSRSNREAPGVRCLLQQDP